MYIYIFFLLRVAGTYASFTKSNKKKKTPIKEERCQKHSFDKDLSETESCRPTGEARKYPTGNNPDRNQWVNHKLASTNVIIASRVYQFLLNQILETTIAPLIELYYF